MTTTKLPVWRSMLFIPAHVEKFVDKAHTRGADAIILDLEDSVPLVEKERARKQVIEAAAKVSVAGADVVVRINAPLRLAVRDLEEVVHPSVKAIIVPKVESAHQLIALSELIDELEGQWETADTSINEETAIDLKETVIGTTKLIALVESPAALSKLNEIANACSRLIAMVIGSEDFSAAVGMLPNADNLMFPNQQLLYAAKSAGVIPLGYAGSIADYSDLPAFEKVIERAKNMGFQGGFCIHPCQVDVLNRGFSPSDQQIAEAEGILISYQQALQEGRGAATYEGKMIDAPVVTRARRILALVERINNDKV